jgi:phospholipase/carboxylesterase
MVHGRGGSAEDILSLARHLNIKEYALVAPEATNNTWYPFPFIAPVQQNEPWLSSALALLKAVVDELLDRGISWKDIYFLGFSQGACLTLEFVARNARRYGGVVAFTGGLIGDKLYPENYLGDFGNMPVFIASSNPDPHIPVARVHASARILSSMNASVTERLYENMGHTITQEEIDLANSMVFN